MFKIIPNKDKRYCQAYRCKNRRPEKDRFCPKHRKRYNKEKIPSHYWYQILKGNARRRGKAFTLTLEEFETFCSQTGYLDRKGKLPSSASIDRIDPSKGYSLDNIQILSLRENSKKRWEDEDPF